MCADPVAWMEAVVARSDKQADWELGAVNGKRGAGHKKSQSKICGLGGRTFLLPATGLVIGVSNNMRVFQQGYVEYCVRDCVPSKTNFK